MLCDQTLAVQFLRYPQNSSNIWSTFLSNLAVNIFQIWSHGLFPLNHRNSRYRHARCPGVSLAWTWYRRRQNTLANRIWMAGHFALGRDDLWGDFSLEIFGRNLKRITFQHRRWGVFTGQWDRIGRNFANLINLWQFFEGLLRIWRNYQPICQFFCCKWPNIEK